MGKDSFIELLNQFSENAHYVDGPYFSAPFIPQTQLNYDQADKKFFYIGQDTYRWHDLSELYDYQKNGETNKYLESQSHFLRSYDFLKYKDRFSPRCFWWMVTKLHLALKGIYNVKVNADLLNNYKNDLSDFGWGNVNAIEVGATIQKIKDEKDDNVEVINWQDYDTLTRAATPINKLKLILDKWHPDIVYIFNRSANIQSYFEGLDYEQLELPTAVAKKYHIKDYDTIVIQTYHPSSRSNPVCGNAFLQALISIANNNLVNTKLSLNQNAETSIDEKAIIPDKMPEKYEFITQTALNALSNNTPLKFDELASLLNQNGFTTSYETEYVGGRGVARLVVKAVYWNLIYLDRPEEADAIARGFVNKYGEFAY